MDWKSLFRLCVGRDDQRDDEGEEGGLLGENNGTSEDDLEDVQFTSLSLAPDAPATRHSHVVGTNAPATGLYDTGGGRNGVGRRGQRLHPDLERDSDEELETETKARRSRKRRGGSSKRASADRGGGDEGSDSDSEASAGEWAAPAQAPRPPPPGIPSLDLAKAQSIQQKEANAMNSPHAAPRKGE